MRGKARGEAAMKSTRQAPRNPRKNNNELANYNAESVAEAISSSMAAWKLVSVKQFYVYYMAQFLFDCMVYICFIYQRKLLRQQNPKAEKSLRKLLLRSVFVIVTMFYFSV